METSCSLQYLTGACGGSIKQRADFTKEERSILHYRTSLAVILTVCENHELTYLRLFPMKQTVCAEKGPNHKAKAARNISYAMFKKLLLVQPSTSLVPGSGLCPACFSTINKSLENITSPPPSPGSEEDEIKDKTVELEGDSSIDAENQSDQGRFDDSAKVVTLEKSQKHEEDDFPFTPPAPVPGTSSGPQTENVAVPSDSSTSDNKLSKTSSFSSTGSTGMGKLNEFLVTKKVSPYQKRKAKRSVSYRESKLAKIQETVQEVVEKVAQSSINVNKEKQHLEEIVQQLKEKYAKAASRQEKVNIISVLPQSWTVDKIVSLFAEYNVTQKFVRGVKELVQAEGGVLPSVRERPKNGLPRNTLDAVLKFYEEDEGCVYIYPDKSKCLSVKINGQKVTKQKRLLLGNLKELHKSFKNQNPEYKISFSKFAELRPKYCLLAGAPGTHTQCVCECHKNIELMINASMLRQFTKIDEVEVKGYPECLKLIRCSDVTFSCVLGRCKNCPGLQPLKELLEGSLQDEETETVTYNSWNRKDKRSQLETVTKDKEDFVEEFLNLMKEVNLHDFLAKSQAKFLRETKCSLKEGEAVVLMDFAENYRFMIQDSVQSYYFGQKECTIHPFIIYHFDKEQNEVRHINYVVISDCLKHTVPTIYTFQKSLISFLKKRLPDLTHINYFSDSPTSQYRNFKNVANLLHHEEDFKITAVWNCFETSHGKTLCDSLGGAIKRSASRASLQGELIRNAQEMFTWANERWNLPEDSKVTVAFVSDQEVSNEMDFLDKRFSGALKVPSIMKMHHFKPISKYQVELKEYSAKEFGVIATVRKEAM